MLETLDRELPDVRSSRPEGGYFVWLDFPGSVDAGELLARAEEAGVTFVPGSDFFQAGAAAGSSSARLAFSYVSPDEIREGVSRLAALLAPGAAGIGATEHAREDPDQQQRAGPTRSARRARSRRRSRRRSPCCSRRRTRSRSRRRRAARPPRTRSATVSPCRPAPAARPARAGASGLRSRGLAAGGAPAAESRRARARRPRRARQPGAARGSARRRWRLARALDERCLDRRREHSLDSEAERRAGSVELEGAERLLVEVAVLAVVVWVVCSFSLSL